MKFLVLALAIVAGVGAKSINSGWVLPAGNIGTSGILRKDGTVELFSHDFAHDIVAIGPSGIVTKNGVFQLDADLNLIRNKRAAALNSGFVSTEGNVGTSGILRKDGSTDLFSHDFAHDILLIGPSGIVTKSGNNVQLTSDLKRTKRHIVGDSGMLTSWGQAIQFKEPFTTILLDGPSGLILSDGQQIQKPQPEQ